MIVERLDALIPEKITNRSDEARRRARLIVYATLFCILVPLPVAWVLALTHSSDVAVVVLLSIVPSALTLLVLRTTGSIHLSGHYLTAWVFAQTAFDFGPDNAFSVLAIFAIPILACATISERAGVFWTLASVAWVASIGWTIPPSETAYFGLIWSAAIVVGVVGFALVILETTRTQARLAAEQATQEAVSQRERLRAFAENAFPVIAEVDMRGTVYVSDAVTDLLGYSVAAFRERPLARYVHPADLPRLLQDLNRVSAHGMRAEARLRHQEGNWVWLEVYAIPYGPGTDRWIFAARDIDAEVQRRDSLQQAQRLESVGILAAGMAHDFNNLLTVSLGFAEMLPPGDEREEIIKANNEAAALTRQLLSFSRVDGLGPAAVECTALIDDLRPMLRGLLGPKIELNLELPPVSLSAAIAAGQLHQVLINLATNALEAMPDGGRLGISVRGLDAFKQPLVDESLPASWIEICVQDSGQGMSAHVRQHAFDPFFSTKESARGSGLGLASVYNIVNGCDGTVSLHSQEEEGTRVCLLLPAAAGEQAQQIVFVDTGMDGVPQGGQTILVVEDELSVRSVLVHTLERAGYNVETASNGFEALTMIRTLEPDLIITDLVMAGMGGADLVTRVRERLPQMRVLFMSGHSSLYEHNWESEPHTRFLAKPFRSSDLLLATRGLLGGAPRVEVAS